MDDVVETPVLIAGGGPVGLALGVALSRLGVDSLIVERRAATTSHPKARGLTSRSMELLRVWGLDAQVRAGSLQPHVTRGAALGWIQHYCETIAGRILGVTNPEVTVHSPEAKCAVAQDVVERVLADAVAATPRATLVRRAEVIDVEPGDSGAMVRIRQLADGLESVISARYVVACDGAASTVRRRVGITMVGPGTLEHMASYYYRADTSHLPHARTTSVFVVYPDDPTIEPGPVLASDPTAQRWLYLQRLGSSRQPLLDDAELIRIIRGHWGIPDLEVTPMGSIRWEMQAVSASTFRAGPVLLAGDAAHCIPPTGGLGLNTGVQDVQNLAWKLAAVIRGAAADSLLDSYDAERRPVAETVLRWSVANHRRLMIEAPAAVRSRVADPQRWRRLIVETDNHTHAEGLSMGYLYRSGAVVDDGADVQPVDSRYYWPTDQPGARFPHAWIDAEEKHSTIDWFDTDFVLVCGTDADAWRSVGDRAGRAAGVSLRVRSLPSMALPIEIGPEGAVLVRPDGHVAWRALGGSTDPAADLGAAIGRILGRAP